MALLAKQTPKIRLQWFFQVDHTLKQEELVTTWLAFPFLSLKKIYIYIYIYIEAEISVQQTRAKQREDTTGEEEKYD